MVQENKEKKTSIQLENEKIKEYLLTHMEKDKGYYVADLVGMLSEAGEDLTFSRTTAIATQLVEDGKFSRDYIDHKAIFYNGKADPEINNPIIKRKKEYFKIISSYAENNAWLNDLKCINGMIAFCNDFSDILGSDKLRKKAEKRLKDMQKVKELYKKRKELRSHMDELGLFKRKEKAKLSEMLEETDNEIAKYEIDKLKEGKDSISFKLANEYDLSKLLEETTDKPIEYNAGNQYGNLQIRLFCLNPKIGEEILFGKYQQKEYGNPEPVEWIVIAKENNKALLLSKKALDYKQFDEQKKYNTWDKCTLRTWLNSEFYDNMFTDSEKKIIMTTDVRVPLSPKAYESVNPVEVLSVYAGRHTNDKMLILSIHEAKEYLNSKLLHCEATEYTKAKTYAEKNVEWWLRNPDSMGYMRTAYVDKMGYIWDLGKNLYDDCGVRPAIWIDLNL